MLSLLLSIKVIALPFLYHSNHHGVVATCSIRSRTREMLRFPLYQMLQVLSGSFRKKEVLSEMCWLYHSRAVNAIFISWLTGAAPYRTSRDVPEKTFRKS